jgi:hypothetical protein
MPRLAPVTSAVRPSKLLTVLLLLTAAGSAAGAAST